LDLTKLVKNFGIFFARKIRAVSLTIHIVDLVR